MFMLKMILINKKTYSYNNINMTFFKIFFSKIKSNTLRKDLTALTSRISVLDINF